MKPLSYHSAARDEIMAAHAWYAGQNAQAAEGFFLELLPALDRVHLHPQRYSPYVQGTRRAVLQRFPFSIVYRELLHEIQIIAVAHSSRRPGYWASRL